MASPNPSPAPPTALKTISTNIPLSLHLIASALLPIVTGAFASLSRPSSAARAPASRRQRRRKRKQQCDIDNTTSRTSDASSDESDLDTVSDSDEDAGEEEENKMEGLAPSDALLFPLMAGSLLVVLYGIIHYFGARILNQVLGVYFAFMAIFSVGKMLDDALKVLGGLAWPEWYVDEGRIWRVSGRRRLVHPVTGPVLHHEHESDPRVGDEDTEDEDDDSRLHPLPGMMGRLFLDEGIAEEFWTYRQALSQQYRLRAHIRGLGAVRTRLTRRAMLTFTVSLGIVLYSFFAPGPTPWYLTNLQGFAFAYTALQLLSPTTFTTGSLVLGALFFYDIYFVFYTPIMVGVATKLDVPIKLVFPRPEEPGVKQPGLAMLGLGDVVIPGIMVGLSLRFDLWLDYLRRQTITKTTKDGKEVEEVSKAKYVTAAGRWGDRFWTRGADRGAVLERPSRRPKLSRANKDQQQTTVTLADVIPSFRKPYFVASLVGYVLGMVVTLGIMHLFQHAQPALLYLVPGVLGSIWLTALVRGEVSAMWNFTELVQVEDDHESKAGRITGKAIGPDSEVMAGTVEEKGKSWLADFLAKSIFGADKTGRSAKRLEKALEKTIKVDTSEDKLAGAASGTLRDAIKHERWIRFSISKVRRKTNRAKTDAVDADEIRGASVAEIGIRPGSSSGDSEESAVLVGRHEEMSVDGERATTTSGSIVEDSTVMRGRGRKA